jgi:hypothetical protein
MPEPVQYSRRNGAMSRGERVWRVEPDALVSRSASGRERAIPWREIVSVRLCHEPARKRPWRYVCELQPKHSRKIVIDNAHYAGEGVYQDRSETYTPFVRAIVQRLAATKPGTRVLIGETPKRYFVLLIASLLALAAVAFALIALPTPFDDVPYANLVKFAVIVLMLPFFWRWVIGITPRGVAPDAVPERALPEPKS